MNVSPPDEFEESADQDDIQSMEELRASDQEPEQVATEPAQRMARSATNPIIINK